MCVLYNCARVSMGIGCRKKSVVFVARAPCSPVLALTPGHFLIGQPIMSLPDTDIRNIFMNRLNRWQLVKQAQQSFWTRWSQEYLTTLQGRQKWFSNSASLNIGDMVVVNSQSRPLMSWQLGRMIDVHPGIDKIIRIVTVKTIDGVSGQQVTSCFDCPIRNAIINVSLSEWSQHTIKLTDYHCIISEQILPYYI